MKRALVLQIDNLSFHYPQRPLFSRFTASVLAGVTLVTGDDGCGKSTLLRMMAGEQVPQAGDLLLNGIHRTRQPQAYREQVFWMDMRSTALDDISARDYFNGQEDKYPLWDAQSLGVLVDGLSLAEHVDKPMYMLSTGTKRKVWLAAAFAAGASLTLLDDPFAALDKPSIAFVLSLLQAASGSVNRAWVLAHYEAPLDVPLASVISL